MSSFTRRIQRSVKRKPDKEGKPIGCHFDGRGSRLGVKRKDDPARLARIEREARNAARAVS